MGGTLKPFVAYSIKIKLSEYLALTVPTRYVRDRESGAGYSCGVSSVKMSKINGSTALRHLDGNQRPLCTNGDRLCCNHSGDRPKARPT